MVNDKIVKKIYKKINIYSLESTAGQQLFFYKFLKSFLEFEKRIWGYRFIRFKWKFPVSVGFVKNLFHRKLRSVILTKKAKRKKFFFFVHKRSEINYLYDFGTILRTRGKVSWLFYNFTRKLKSANRIYLMYDSFGEDSSETNAENKRPDGHYQKKFRSHKRRVLHAGTKNLAKAKLRKYNKFYSGVNVSLLKRYVRFRSYSTHFKQGFLFMIEPQEAIFSIWQKLMSSKLGKQITMLQLIKEKKNELEKVKKKTGGKRKNTRSVIEALGVSRRGIIIKGRGATVKKTKKETSYTKNYNPKRNIKDMERSEVMVLRRMKKRENRSRLPFKLVNKKTSRLRILRRLLRGAQLYFKRELLWARSKYFGRKARLNRRIAKRALITLKRRKKNYSRRFGSRSRQVRRFFKLRERIKTRLFNKSENYGYYLNFFYSVKKLLSLSSSDRYTALKYARQIGRSIIGQKMSIKQNRYKKRLKLRQITLYNIIVGLNGRELMIYLILPRINKLIAKFAAGSVIYKKKKHRDPRYVVSRLFKCFVYFLRFITRKKFDIMKGSGLDTTKNYYRLIIRNSLRNRHILAFVRKFLKFSGVFRRRLGARWATRREARRLRHTLVANGHMVLKRSYRRTLFELVRRKKMSVNGKCFLTRFRDKAKFRNLSKHEKQYLLRLKKFGVKLRKFGPGKNRFDLKKRLVLEKG